MDTGFTRLLCFKTLYVMKKYERSQDVKILKNFVSKFEI